MSHSWMPAQFDSIYLEIESDPTQLKAWVPGIALYQGRCKTRLLSVLLTDYIQLEVSKSPPTQMPIESSGCYLYFKQNLAHQNLGKPSFPTRLLIYYKRILENKNQQPEEQIPWAKLGERAQNFHFHSMCATFLTLCVKPSRKFSNSVFWVFMEASLHKQDWLKPLAIVDWFNHRLPQLSGTQGKRSNIISLHLSLKKFQGFWKMWTRNCG